MRTLIRNGYIIAGPRNVLGRGYVCLDSRVVSDLGEGDPPLSLVETTDYEVDASGCAVLPGFINAHTHIFQVLLKGLGCGLSLEEWAESVIWPALELLTLDDLYV